MGRLTSANLLLLLLLAGHTLDHAVNQPARELPVSADVVGVGGLLLVTGSLALALRRSRLAPAGASLVGLVTALGVVAVHVAPQWWPVVSDPYWSFDAGPVSWIMLLAPLAAALWLLLVGLAELRLEPQQAGGREPLPAER